jgi:hypothetical protein
MTTSYELWNVESGNIIGSFMTADDVLDAVRHLLQSYGRKYALDLSLGRREGECPATIVGEGRQLLTMLDLSQTEARRSHSPIR